MKLYSPKVIGDIKKDYGFSLSKSLGQNFLTDKNTIDKIIDQSNICHDDLVIEVGPGIGVITKELAQRAGYVVAIEIDKRLIPVLQDTLSDFDNVEIVNEDILEVDVNSLIESVKSKVNTPLRNAKIVGNLPYYITTPIVMKFLEEKVDVSGITVMMQKEVADRIEADEHSKDRGSISVAVQYYCTVHRIANVSKDVFVPRPKVDSAVLRLDVRKSPPVKVIDDKLFFKAVKSGFSQRRKTIHNSLSSGLLMEKELLGRILDDLEIDRKRRAETLSIEEFARISNAIFTCKNKERNIEKG